MKAVLIQLSSALLKFHKELLMSQIALIEKVDMKQYTPYEMLNLTMNDLRFAWLKRFSDLILKIDAITDDKENKPFDAFSIHQEVKNAISIDSADATPEFKRTLQSDLSLMVTLNEVRKSLGVLDSMLKAEMN